ncbi:MAG: hypothetical protein OWR52_14000 [Acidibacillus sp.]|nr:hypothetical protein [Acidibacillus sp.]
MGSLRSELYRAYHRKGPYVAFLFGILLAFSGYIATQYGQIVPNDGGVAHEFNTWYMFLQTFGINWNSPWGLVMPLLVVLPFGDTLIFDLNHGFEVPLILRVGMKRYFFSKWFANVIVVATVFGAVLISSLIIAIVWRHDFQMPLRLLEDVKVVDGKLIVNAKAFAINKSHHFNGVFASSYAPKLFSKLFWRHIGLFTLLTMLISLLATVSVSSIALVASLWLKNRYLVLAAPFVVFMFFVVVPQYITPSLFMWAPHILADAFWEFYRPFWGIVLYWLAPLLVTLGLMNLGSRRYRDLQLIFVEYKE